MTDDNNQLEKISTTFRFSSGQVLALDEHQIATIPYLAAMVSSADRFDSARDEHGHYKLDPNINYQHFSLILQSLPFHSVRQVFTCLPDEENVIPIVALLDFLGLLPYSLPSLEEVDSIFFSSVVYSPYCKEHLRIVKPDVLQDMAVRFAIAMIKEEYDFDQSQVMDQIHWFVMFIVSANEWFGRRLRHHVYTTVKNCFKVFNPSLLKLLKKLKNTPKKEASKGSSVPSNENFCLSNKCLYSYLSTNITFDAESNQSTRYSFVWWRYLLDSELPTRKFVCSVYENEEWFPCGGKLRNEDPSEIIYRRVLEIMYARLQNEVCQQARAELQQQTYARKCVPDNCYLWIPFDYETSRKKIEDILGTQRILEEIDALILQDICFLTPKLEHEHAKLVQSIRNDEEIDGDLDEDFGFSSLLRYLHHSSDRTRKRRPSSYKVLLDKLYKDPYSVVKQIRARVLVGLDKVAFEQCIHWMMNREEINELETKLQEYGQCNKSPFTGKKKNKHQPYQIPAPKPFLNRHFKYSKR